MRNAVVSQHQTMAKTATSPNNISLLYPGTLRTQSAQIEAASVESLGLLKMQPKSDSETNPDPATPPPPKKKKTYTPNLRGTTVYVLCCSCFLGGSTKQELSTLHCGVPAHVAYILYIHAYQDPPSTLNNWGSI